MCVLMRVCLSQNITVWYVAYDRELNMANCTFNVYLVGEFRDIKTLFLKLVSIIFYNTVNV